MTSPPPADPLDAALRIASAFEARGISYALGGALAYGIWAIPRATADVDINVFVEGEALDRVCETLAELGAAVDTPAAREASRREGMFVARWGLFRLDVFTPSIDFAWEAERTRVRREIDGRAAWFLSAESIAVFKLLFFRGKDVVDLERLVALAADLDVDRVRAHVVAMMGADDERVARWDALVAAARGDR